jgi:hypothetical protein
VLLHLSEEWLRLLSALQTSGVAHGDLQHGNIIVEHGQLRLVDHDGIFVTRMMGWTASEVGHQHYQHPRRNAQHFDAKLDRFSSLVIYLSLLSLAEQPSLWREHHDENLLFTKADFANPETSSLFRKIRDLGPEHSRLADVLASAANGPPTNVPCLLDLVKTQSTLPAWMTAPADLEATTRTREVVSAEPRVERTARWIPWQERSRGSAFPSTPSSATVQSLFSTPPAAPVVRDPDAVLQNAWMFSKEFVRKYFLVWYWGTYVLLEFLGFDLFVSVFVALIFLLLGCLTYGLVRALNESQKAKRSPAIAGGQQPTVVLPPVAPGSWNPQVNLPATPVSATTVTPDPFIGNMVLGIYHLNNCYWVDSISSKNRVGFATVSEATSHGFKPCRICTPTS